MRSLAETGIKFKKCGDGMRISNKASVEMGTIVCSSAGLSRRQLFAKQVHDTCY